MTAISYHRDVKRTSAGIVFIYIKNIPKKHSELDKDSADRY